MTIQSVSGSGYSHPEGRLQHGIQNPNLDRLDAQCTIIVLITAVFIILMY